MPLFMDVHTVSGATAEAVAGAHQKDLQVQPQYGVKYVKYWLDEGRGRSSASPRPRTKRLPFGSIAKLTGLSPTRFTRSRKAPEAVPRALTS
jgi:hypothetical protein